MTWNHRVFKSKEGYSIKEAFYDSKKRLPETATVDDISPFGESLDELREVLTMMLRATFNPVLKFDSKDKIREFKD